MQLGELRPGDLIATAFAEPALVEQVDRYAPPSLEPPFDAVQGDGPMVRLHLVTPDGSRSWATAWMAESARIQGTVHRLDG